MTEAAVAGVVAYLQSLLPADRAVVDAALAAISEAFAGALPVPVVTPDGLQWSAPEGYVIVSASQGLLHWSGRYEARAYVGTAVHSDPASPEGMMGLGLLDFMEAVLMRREALEDLRQTLLRELRIARDPRAVLTYLVGPSSGLLLSAGEYDTYGPMSEFSDSDRALGKVAFDAYSASKGGVTYDNKPIPAWADVGPDVQKGWIVAARAVKTALDNR